MQKPTCKTAVGAICIDLPGSPAPPAAKESVAASAGGIKSLAQTAVTSTTGGVLYYVDTNQTIHQTFWNGSSWSDINIMASSQSGYHVAPGAGVTVDANGIVYYVDTVGDVHQTYWGGSKFPDADFMASSQSGYKVQAGSGVAIDSSGSTYYVSTGQTVGSYRGYTGRFLCSRRPGRFQSLQRQP